MPITEYGKYMEPAGKAGQLANFQDFVADSYAVAEVVPFGAAVQLNATGDAISPIKTGGTVIGIALAQNIHDYVEKKDDQKYKVAQPAAIVKRGRIFVVAGGDIINGQAVKVDATTQKFTTDGAIEVKNAVFKSNATANQLVEIEINLP
ncbi:structural cement protein Gp24 [Viridibacillus sp. NPDC096237]|uniref:structural cement protein Gp24 n=1 Tax=Viridibacillus sp. NPDC096237 TaxID=3390721 RepID=UPI003D018E78